MGILHGAKPGKSSAEGILGDLFQFFAIARVGWKGLQGVLAPVWLQGAALWCRRGLGFWVGRNLGPRSLKSPRYPQNCRRWVLQHGLSWEPPSFGFLSKKENDLRLEELAWWTWVPFAHSSM